MKKIDLLKQQLLFLQSHNGSQQEIAEIEKKIEQSKRGRRSKNKGRSYENVVKDIFNKKYPNLKLVRTPASGGFQKESNNEDLRGDVSNINKEFRFMLHIEAKNQATLKIKDWMKQAIGDCPKGKYPSVVFHQQQEIKEGKRTLEADDFICMRLKDFLEIVSEEALIQKGEVKNSGKTKTLRSRKNA